MPRITVQDFARKKRCLRIGDIVYLPTLNVTPKESERLRSWARGTHRFQRLAKKMGWRCYNGRTEQFTTQPIEESYMDYRREHKREPLWARGLDREILSQLRRGWANDQDLLFAVHEIPFTGINWCVEEDGPHRTKLIEALWRKLALARLGHIKQLACLLNPAVAATEGYGYAWVAHNHSRENHSFDAAMIGRLIAYNLGLPDKFARNLVASGLLHDFFTPALGDTAKIAAAAELNEDARFEELFRKPAWPALRRRYNLSNRKLLAAVKGVGLIGDIQDLADKCSYVATDAWFYYHYCTPACDADAGDQIIGELIRQLLERNPNICALWDCVDTVVHGGEERLVITDIGRLEQFLLLRALLIRGLYYNPAARFLEYVVGAFALRFLIEIKEVTIEQLLRQVDHELIEPLNSVFGYEPMFLKDNVLDTLARHHNGRAQAFATKEEALAREREILADNPKAVILLEDFRVKTGTGGKILTRDEFGVVRPFRMLERLHLRIENLIRVEKPFRLYWFDGTHFWDAPKFQAALASYRAHRGRLE